MILNYLNFHIFFTLNKYDLKYKERPDYKKPTLVEMRVMINQFQDNHTESFQNKQKRLPTKKRRRFFQSIASLKKKSTALLIAGCLLISGMCGFGGSIIASSLSGSGSFIYKTAGHTTNTNTTTTSSDKTLTTEEIANAASPTVVSITTESKQTSKTYSDMVTTGAGSGVIITSDGYIITCNHVISGASKITITTNDNKDYEATVVGTDSTTDMALLKINANGLQPAVIGDSDSLKVGENAVVIGNPLGELSGTVTEGIISAKDRDIDVEGQEMTLLQTSATVNPGNSGGGLFNQYGELVGIVVAKSSGDDVEGLGFAIPVNSITSVIDSLKSDGYVKGRASLGVSLIDVSDTQTAMQYHVNDIGVYISKVNDNSAASKAGLKSGDRIVSVDGTDVSTTSDVKKIIQGKSAGDTIKIKISRNSQTSEVSVTLDESTN